MRWWVARPSNARRPQDASPATSALMHIPHWRRKITYLPFAMNTSDMAISVPRESDWQTAGSERPRISQISADLELAGSM